MSIHIKTIYTRFNPLYIALGNQGQLVYVEEYFQGHYEYIAMYKLPLKNGMLEGYVKREPSAEPTGLFKAYVTLKGKDINKGLKAAGRTPQQAAGRLIELIGAMIEQHEEIIKETYPDFMEEEGQLSFF